MWKRIFYSCEVEGRKGRKSCLSINIPANTPPPLHHHSATTTPQAANTPPTYLTFSTPPSAPVYACRGVAWCCFGLSSSLPSHCCCLSFLTIFFLGGEGGESASYVSFFSFVLPFFSLFFFLGCKLVSGILALVSISFFSILFFLFFYFYLLFASRFLPSVFFFCFYTFFSWLVSISLLTVSSFSCSISLNILQGFSITIIYHFSSFCIYSLTFKRNDICWTFTEFSFSSPSVS